MVCTCGKDHNNSSSIHTTKYSKFFFRSTSRKRSEARNGGKSTIIFIRYKDKKGKETSAYIDYRQRFKKMKLMVIF